jgi:hypothetical protein
MANLTKAQAEELIKTPANAKEIRRARQKRIRHQLHTEPETDTLSLGPGHWRFLEWVRKILKNDESYQRFRELYRPPVFTNELTESIFSAFEKVFEAENSYEKFNFTDAELENDAADYRKRLGDFQFWETQGFETFKNSIDNVVVVDLPALDETGNMVTSDGKPQPYYYILDIDNLHDINNTRVKGVDETGEVFFYFKTEYVIFKGSGDTMYVFDDTFYRTYLYKDGNVTFVSEAAHGLTFCPARSFWTTPLNSATTIQKRSPITNSLSELDWLLFFSIARKYLELYAPFPLYIIYKGACTYKTEGKAKAKCVDGYLKYEGKDWNADLTGREKCPKCSNTLKVGPGGIIELRVPKDKEDPDLMANPMKIIPAERTSLDYMQLAIKEKYDAIFDNCVGKGTEIANKQAQNEMQIQASFESKTAVLLKIKRNFEIIHSFALDTVFKLRYGDSYQGCTIDYGDQFFLKDEETQTDELQTAITAGAPSYEIATRRKEIWNVTYRNNPDMLERMKILRELEPFPDTSLVDVIQTMLPVKGLVSLKDVIIKLNFNSFIDRFEREQTNLLQFGSALPFDKKIDSIQEELDAYADEYAADNAADALELQAAGAAGAAAEGGDAAAGEAAAPQGSGDINNTDPAAPGNPGTDNLPPTGEAQ